MISVIYPIWLFKWLRNKMTNFDKMEQNFVALTEEELMDVDGGAWPIVAWVIANPVTAAKIAGGITAVGIAGYNYVTGRW